jgi:hypothetical protein
MLRAVDLLHQGRKEELWQMCCGFLTLRLDEFMNIQRRLLLEQLEMLGGSSLGKKIMRGRLPKTVEEFRRQVPLTTYADYCPELLEKREDVLPVKPELWSHSAGRSGEYPCKWVPMTSTYVWELSKVLYGVGMLSCCDGWGDTSHIPDNINILYAVAPVPYISGTFADILRMQSPLHYLPTLEEAKDLSFEERIKVGFEQAMSEGFDYFFGLSLVLMNVGEKIYEASNTIDLRRFLKHPKALWRLSRGKIRSSLAGRPVLPRDLWKIKGIIGSGTDSYVYKDKIKELWGRSPLDLYACTEGSVIATQTWDYNGMTFVPGLNFLEFTPEDELVKWEMDRSYQPETLLLDEVEPGKNYEIVITNFHGGALVRYRIGDMVRITSLWNEELGINIPQMAFERRVDDFIDFYVVNFTERSIWQAIESTGVAYEDWVAYKDAKNQLLNIGLELKDGYQGDKADIAALIYEKLARPENNKSEEVTRYNDLTDLAYFGVKVDFLPKGNFANYIAQRQTEGADLAHLKPPHVNPPKKVLSMLTDRIEETIVVTKSGAKVREKSAPEEVSEEVGIS